MTLYWDEFKPYDRKKDIEMQLSGHVCVNNQREL